MCARTNLQKLRKRKTHPNKLQRDLHQENDDQSSHHDATFRGGGVDISIPHLNTVTINHSAWHMNEL